ncbi:hypothetical protein GQ607_017222 [Colletotrichum asianum]|uniref:Uncharacterized protein n=1 Tax=Colletotrichum asianum TaxID=702518 RepID=A0A8H3VZG7_9PEZI|nr:hypothetical protein GQ607_017222 [Colletotrichum asianum]
MYLRILLAYFYYKLLIKSKTNYFSL